MGNSDKRRKIWAEREANGLCIYCGKRPHKKGSKGCKTCSKKKSIATCKFSKANKEATAQYRLLIKHEVIEKYGGKCACCVESQILFLTIDHKNNDGNKERKEVYGIKNPATTSWYLKLRREPTRKDLQVLCFNCNLGKSINGGVCPHQQVNVVLHAKYDRRHDSQFDKRLKIVWPNDDELIIACNNTSVSQVARGLGVNFTAVSGRLERRGIYHLVSKKSGGVKKGETNAAAKLTAPIVLDIRDQAAKKIPRKELAKQYNVSVGLIDKIVNRKMWKHI